MLHRWLGLLFVIAVVLIGTVDAWAERRVALVVGNAQYEHTSALKNPVNDAREIGALLERLGFEVLVSTDLDQAEFARTIDSFGRRLEGADVGLFFYTGHGLQMNGKNYLVSTEARLESEFLIPAETVQLDAVIHLMESRTPVNLVFLDACRNNPLADKLRNNLIAQNRSVALGRGLARVQATGRDTLIAYSAAPNQEAADGRGANSPFTSALLQYLPTPDVEVSVMLKRVAGHVRTATHGEQRPQQLSDMTRTFYFAKVEPVVAQAAPVAKPKVAEAAPDHTVEVAYWNSARAANDCASVRAYLDRFPNGIFVDLAKLSERRLCEPTRKVTIAETATPDDSASKVRNVPSPPMGLGAAVAKPSAPPKPAAATEPKPTTPAEATETKTAALPPETAAPRQESTPDRTDLARGLQAELNRVGCAAGPPDGVWGSRSERALREFSRHAGVTLDVDEPSQQALGAVKRHRKRVCPTVTARPPRTDNRELGRSRQSDQPRQRTEPSERSPGYAWCADMPAGRAMATNCGFTTLAQCQATVSGLGGYCYRNSRP